jgi:DNA repair exonuclease SbcCD ATPase subunit
MSKIKILFVSVIVAVGLAAPVVVQQQTIKDLRAENEGLKQQIAPLQDQVTRATQEAANASGDATSKESQVRDLARLRAEVSQLRRTTNELTKARQEIQVLNQRVESETAARKDQAAAIQSESQKMQAERAMNACINNLRLIDAAKQQWALENRKQAADTPRMEDLRPYIGRGPNGDLPVCHDGGVYTVGTVGEKPACSIPGHVLP